MNSRSFLVLTARTDESQFDDLVESLRLQEGITYRHEVISGLDSISAEKAIHKLSLEVGKGFDYVAKLDADMVILDNWLLFKIAHFFENHNSIGRVSLPVEDFYTNVQIMGVHFFRSAAVPKVARIEKPNPDKWIDGITGVHIESTPSKFVNHGYSPSLEQASRFGVHRALKAMASGYKHAHWVTLIRLYKAWRANPEDTSLCYCYFSASTILMAKRKYGWEIVDSGSPSQLHFAAEVRASYEQWKSSNLEKMEVKEPIQFYRTNYPGIWPLIYIRIKILFSSIRLLKGRMKWFLYFGRW